MTLLFALFCGYGCRAPESTYETIKEEVDRGEYTSASTEADRALQRFRGRSPEWEWRFRILKARIILSSAKGEDALAVLEPEPPDSLTGTEIPEQRKLYQGIAHTSAQQFVAADRDFEAAATLAARLGAFYTCQFLIADAALLVDEKKYNQAEAEYRDALALARQQASSRFEATVLADWARLATDQRHYDEALERSLEAIHLSKSLDLKGNTATILGNLGWIYSELGDFEASLEFFKQSAQASAKTGQKGYSTYWFSGAAASYMALREYEKAESLARSTLESARDLNDAETTTLCLNTLADVMLRTNRLAEAQRFNQQALKIEESGKDKLVTLDSLALAGEISTAAARFSDADEFFRRVLGDPMLEPQVRWRAEAGLAQVREGQGKPIEAENEYLKAIGTIEEARRSVHHDELRLSFLSSGIEVYGRYIDFLIRHNRSADALNQAELSRARTLAEGLSADEQPSAPKPAPRMQPQQLAQRLNATLLFYWLGEKQSYLWVVSPVKTTCLTLPAAPQIEHLVKSYREAITGSQDVAETQTAEGEKLYAALVAPAQKLIPQNARVILLPDGSLYSLNFETLIVPQPKPHFWIEDVTLTTASSLSLLASAANRQPPSAGQKNLLLVGDAVKASDEFEPLPGAEDEMKIVERYFAESNRKVLRREQAKPSAYLASNPERYAYLHFVTHGTASRTRPLESAVILSKESANDTYKLYARDIVTRHLNAELVTISACNGSGTRAYSGEGLVGLSWAFVRAGAHNVIAALWEVSNAPSTSQLMDAFYKGISQGQDPATALRNAKLSFLRSPNPNYAFKKPYYWAPFQLYTGS